MNTFLTPNQIGKRFERDLEDAFRGIQREFGFKFHRFVDTHEAGNVVREQPADYLVTTPQGLALVEAKASVTLPYFRPSLLRPAQKGAIKHYAQMLQVPYYVLFRNDADDRVDLLNGKDCLVLEGRKPVTPLASTRTKQLGTLLTRVWDLDPLRAVLRDYNLRYGEQDAA